MKAIVFLILVSRTVFAADDFYLVGAGQSDITGPVADEMMMGYVTPKQKTAGISTRLRARAFVIDDGKERLAIVTSDLCHQTIDVTQAVLKKLKSKFGDLYTEKNTLLMTTHTHSGPAGYSHHALYAVSSLGFSQANFDKIVNGITESIIRAHDNMVPASIHFNEGTLSGANINRSAAAYLENPVSERAKYVGDVDTQSTVLRFDALTGEEIGVLNWFSVHPTSMNAQNHLISADNKGYAALKFERLKGNRYQNSKGFVAAFANSNAGDASPATAGKDLNGDGDWDCPLGVDRECTRWNGTLQFEKAKDLYDHAREKLAGEIEGRHQFVDMSQVQIEPEFADGVRNPSTCLGAVGLSMLAGAEDHRGIGREGQRCTGGTAGVRLLCRRDPCHGEKPIVVMMGRHAPPWSPQVMPVQILRIGQIALVALPGEFTTMSGRRIRETVASILTEIGIRHVVLAGYANAYAGYVATREEYQLQDYEGASTHFGEWTQRAYEQAFAHLAESLRDRTIAATSLTAPDATRIVPRIIAKLSDAIDSIPSGRKFGDLIKDAVSDYAPGEVVRVEFWAANPNHSFMTQNSYLEVQKKTPSGWEVVAYDWDEETRFSWLRVGARFSKALIEWEIPANAEGIFRIRHLGDFRSGSGRLVPYEGYSSEWTVRP